jgi:peptidoglycan/xylan/chitin deacetylase (PgdA/CDA1 family)
MVEFIMYHYVREIRNSKYPGIKALDLSDFKLQVEYLKKYYTIISIEDFFNKDYNVNTKNCILTFDDGYIDHYDYVFELLIKNSIQGSFFAPVNAIENREVLDVNKIHILLSTQDEKSLLDRISFYLKEIEVLPSFEDFVSQVVYDHNYYDSYTTTVVKRLLQTILPKQIRKDICNSLINDFLDIDERDLSDQLYLKKHHISEMLGAGMHFGGHGKEHEWLGSLDIQNQELEFQATLNFLDEMNNKPYLRTMCYPYGDYNDATIHLMKKYNFKIGLTTRKGFYSNNEDLFTIPRFDTNEYYPKS